MRRLTFLSLLAGALVACSGEEPARKCTTEAECPSGARCRGSVCVENSPPVAAVSAPAAPVEFALVTLSGVGSSDPDPEDASFTYRWTVRSTGAPCQPPVVAGTAATAQVRFGCAGAYEVALVVEDGLGAASAPVTAAVNVAADPGPSIVTAGADLSGPHTCAGSPLRCTLEAGGGSFTLHATGPSSGVGFRWTVQPPAGRELGAGRRVTFTPGPDVLQPEARIETDGLAISGDWIFRLEAYDDAGALGAAVTRVSVGNRPPVVIGVPGAVPHQFVQMTQRFEAAGSIAVTVSDPDGDPLVRQVATHQVNAGATSTFTATDQGATIAFAIAVPYDGPAAAGRLLGGPGLARDVELSVADANGETTKEHWDVVVENRPPVGAWGNNAPVHADHAYQASPAAYVATAELSTWTDPDGDPLEAAPVSEVGPCGQPGLVGGKLLVTCSVPFTGSPAANLIVGSWDVAHAVRDPWTRVDHARELAIHNRPPTFKTASFSAAATCSTTPSCCEFDMGQCVTREREWAATSIPSGGWLEDPDGDPLLVTFGPSEVGFAPSTRVCLPDDCQFTFSVPVEAMCGVPSAAAFSATISDGGPSVQSPAGIQRVCK